jgi:hypothetical protein
MFVVFAIVLAMPLFHVHMAERGRSFARHEDLVIAVPLSFLLLAHGVGAFRVRPARQTRWATAPVTAGVVTAALAAGLVGSFALVGEQPAAMPLALSARAPFVTVRGDEAGEIEAIRQAIEAKQQDVRVAVIGFEGYRFMRAVAGDERFLHYVNWDFGLINHNTKGKRLYLLVPKPEGAARFDDVNVKFPALYDEADVRLDGDGVRALLQAVDRPFTRWRLIYATRYYPPAQHATGEFERPAAASPDGEPGSNAEQPVWASPATEIHSSP